MLVAKKKAKLGRPKLPEPAEPAKEEKSKLQLDKEYTQAKIDLTRVRERSAILILAREREELIEVELVQKQLAYMLTAFRQRMLAIPTTHARRVMHKSNVNEVANILKEAIHQALREVADMPQRAVDPNWLKTLDEDEA